MTLDQFLNLVATIFGAIGSIYVLKSTLRLTPEITERLSSNMYGHNPSQIDSLSTQKSESVVGTSLIFIALFIAIANAGTTPTNIIVHHNRLYAILLSIILSVFVYSLLLIVGKVVNSHHRLATARIITAKTLDRLFENKSIPSYEVKSLRYLNDKYLHLELSPDKTSKDLIRLIAKDVGRAVPEDIKIEGEFLS